MFVVSIGNAKNVEVMKLNVDAPMLQYRQNTLNCCCFSTLVSDFESINQNKDENIISKRIEESLTSQVILGITLISKNSLFEQKLYYNRNKYKQKGYFNILNKIGAAAYSFNDGSFNEYVYFLQ